MSRSRPLTGRDLDTLHELDAAIRCCRVEWATPMLCGGYNGSHHSATLAKLVRHGCVESKRRGGYSRGSKQYRLTDEGHRRLSAWLEARRTRKRDTTKAP